LTALHGIREVVRCYGTYQEVQTVEGTQIIVLEKLQNMSAMEYLEKLQTLTQSHLWLLRLDCYDCCFSS
jgi:hypothetical protein